VLSPTHVEGALASARLFVALAPRIDRPIVFLPERALAGTRRRSARVVHARRWRDHSGEQRFAL